MKRVLFFLSGGLLLAGSAQAQLGVRIGGNAPIFTKAESSGSSSLTTQRRPGYQASVFYQVPLTARLSLVPEVQFSRERFSVDRLVEARSPLLPGDYVDNIVGYSYEQSLSYLSVPILLRATFGALYLEAGPQIGLLVGGRAEGTQTELDAAGNNKLMPIDKKATEIYHRFDAGPTVGVGLKLPAGLGLGLRAYWGLTKLSDETYAGFQHRQTLQAALTYQLAAR